MLNEKKKIGLIAGVFDLVHAGHVLALRGAKAQCDYLIVALHVVPTDDPSKNRPVMSVFEREIILRACRYVDEVDCYRSERQLLHMLIDRHVDIRFLGEDYRYRPIVGSELPIEMRFLPRSHGLSTSGLRKRVCAAEVARARASPIKRRSTVGAEESEDAVR